MKKPIIIILICAVIACAVILFLLFGFNYAGERGTSTQTATHKETAEVSAETGTAKADADIADYSEVNMEDYENGETTEALFSERISLLKSGFESGWADYSPLDRGFSPVFDETDMQFGYILNDIDGDERNELYIGAVDGDSMRIYQIYTSPEEGELKILYRSYAADDYYVVTEKNVFVNAVALQAAVQEETTEQTETEAAEQTETEAAESGSEATETETETMNLGARVLSGGKFESTAVPDDLTLKKLSPVIFDE